MKLWFFRTPKGEYRLSADKPSRLEMNGTSELVSSPWQMRLGNRKLRGLPTLKLGACIPVELVPVEKKKARK